MTGLVILVVIALVFTVVWINLEQNRNPKAKLGPDGTNVREPESFVVHHEGKAQGLDIANTALKERTENLRRDLPGPARQVKAPVPGRDLVHMAAPPSDVSRFGDEKVAPGAEPKEKVLTAGPVGSRPETPEEPGSPYAKGRRVTDIHRDVELAAEALPQVFAGRGPKPGRALAVSPSTNGQEPGYGLGRTAPGETDGEGGFDGARVGAVAGGGGKVIQFRSRMAADGGPSEGGITFRPDPSWSQELSEELDWAPLQETPPLPEAYGDEGLVALVRSPRSLYVYWSTGGPEADSLRRALGEGWQRTTPCLRVFDVTADGAPGSRSFSIEIGEHDDHWFINEGLEPGRRYAVSLERRSPDGTYYMLSHSSPVQMPHEGPAAVDMLYRLYGGRPGAASATSPWR